MPWPFGRLPLRDRSRELLHDPDLPAANRARDHDHDLRTALQANGHPLRRRGDPVPDRRGVLRQLFCLPVDHQQAGNRGV